MARTLFTVAHAEKGQGHTDFDLVRVYRTHHHYSVAAALRKAGRIRRAGYLVWIEQTGRMASR